MQFSPSSTNKCYFLVNEELKSMLKWSQLRSVKSWQQWENPLKDIKESLRNLGCFKYYTTVRHCFSVKFVSFSKSSFFFANSQSKWRVKCQKQNYKYGIYLKCQSNERPKWTWNFGRILSCDSSWTGKRRNKNLTPITYKRTELRLSSLLNCKLLSRSEIRYMLMSGWQSR